MSVLPAEVSSALTELLENLQSVNNEVRSQAEKQLSSDWFLNRADVLLMGLSEQMDLSPDPAYRKFAAVLFRRYASRVLKDDGSDGEVTEAFITLQEPQRIAIQTKLLEALSNAPSKEIGNKISDAVAEIARQYTDNGMIWPELLDVLFQYSQSPLPSKRESAFRIFATSPKIIEKQHEEVVLGSFTKGLKDEDSGVRLAAMDAFSAFFRSLNKKSQKKYYSLIPELLNILPPLKESGDSEQLSSALLSLVELAEVAPKMFSPQFNNLVNFSVTVIQDKELEDRARQNALELMATFADQAPKMCKRDPDYTTKMVTQCLSLMTDVGMDDEDCEEWNASEDLDIDESDMNHVAGEQCMDRLANKLGGQALLPPTFNWLPRMLSSSAWRDRHGALMAISAISEGCRDLMIGELDKVLDLVLPALRDPHARVRWAGCNAVGQISTDFSNTVQKKYHHLVLTNIIPVLKSPEPRLQAHAAAALVNFCEEAETSILEPYLDNLLAHLLELLQSPRRFVQEQALSTIATVADSAEQAFGKFYDTLMPLLFNVLEKEQSKEYRLLRAKAMECATLIALAVKKERMRQDAIALMNLLGRIQQNITDPDDPQASYLLHCWGRMCGVLGQDFVPYLPAVIPPLMELASAKADIQLIEDEAQVSQLEQDDVWELVPLKGKNIGIKTSTLDDKHVAIELIIVYAQSLGGAFEPYVEHIMDKIAIPGLVFFFHDPVRMASAKCIPQLLGSMKKAHPAGSPRLIQLFNRTVEKVLEGLGTEPAIEILAEMYQCFYECVDLMGPNCLQPQHMDAFMTSTKAVLDDYIERVNDRMAEIAEREEDEDEPEDFISRIEDDQTLLSDMNKAFHTIFKQMRTAFLPYWQRLLPTYNQFAMSPQDPTQRQWAICIHDDVLEFCGPESSQYLSHIVPPLINGLRDDVPANRQAASYGIGIAAQKAGPEWAEFVAASIPELFAVTQRPGARDEDDVFATENACASIAKILHFSPSKVEQIHAVTAAWVETLPIIHDDEAGPYAYGYLAEVMDRRSPAVMSPSQATKCFIWVAQALHEETLQGNNATRVAESTKSLVAANGLVIEDLMMRLSPEIQQSVRVYFA